MDGENIQTIFPNFSALKTHFISNIYALVDHGIKFYQFQSLSNLHFYKTLNLEEKTLRFHVQVLPMLSNKREEQNSTQLTWHRLSYHYPHIKTEAKQIS